MANLSYTKLDEGLFVSSSTVRALRTRLVRKGGFRSIVVPAFRKWVFCAVAVLMTFIGDVTVVSAAKPVLDSPTPAIVILGAIQERSDLRIEVEIRSFTMGGGEYSALSAHPSTENPPRYGMEPQRPNFGHIHVYLTPYSVVKPAKFMMVDALSSGDRGEFVLKDVKPGRYRLLVELVKTDHAPRLKAQSQDFPPMDMINVTIGVAK